MESSLEQLLEAVLFVSEGPQGVDELARVLGCDTGEVEHALESLEASLAHRGVRVARLARKVQLVTAPEAGPVVERLLGEDASGRLSGAALETLAVIAYRQPVTRAQVEAIRGVNSDGVIRTLVSRGLVTSAGRLEQVGRPELLATTFEFLQYFGVSSLDELPPLPEPDEAPVGD